MGEGRKEGSRGGAGTAHPQQVTTMMASTSTLSASWHVKTLFSETPLPSPQTPGREGAWCSCSTANPLQTGTLSSHLASPLAPAFSKSCSPRPHVSVLQSLLVPLLHSTLLPPPPLLPPSTHAQTLVPHLQTPLLISFQIKEW